MLLVERHTEVPKLSDHHAATITKLLLIGDSSSGKTGALASLAAAGYNLRILDLDNGLDVLFNYLRDPKSPYPKESLDRVDYVTLTDPMRQIGGRLSALRADAWPKMTSLLERWKDNDIDLGKPSDWGPMDILVIDSLTMVANAAMNYHLSINGALGASRTQNESRRDIGAAQGFVEKLLQLLYDRSMKCNVIVTAHVVYSNEDGTTPVDGESKPQVGYPTSIGKALSPRIPRYFNNMLNIRTVGSGTAAKHQIQTHSQGTVGGKSSAPLKVKGTYPIETGLADYFRDLRS